MSIEDKISKRAFAGSLGTCWPSSSSCEKCQHHRCLTAVQALVTLDPGVLFVLEGTGQADKFPGMSWGNGFIVDPSQVARYNLSSAQYFFENLVAVPDLASRTILSGHVYGPETTVSIQAIHSSAHDFIQ